MRIEFHHWAANTEIMLIEKIGESEVVKDRFYTRVRQLGFGGIGNSNEMDAKRMFALLEDFLPPPNIAGAWAEHHPAMQRYRAKHPNVVE